MPYIIYNDTPTHTQSGGGFRGSKTPYQDLAANRFWLTHFSNFMYLDFIAKKSEDRLEQHQARKEIVICQHKMDYWKRHPNWSMKIVDPEVARIKRQWASGISKSCDTIKPSTRSTTG